MSVRTQVMELATSLPANTMFTTRMMLDFGHRRTVDSVMFQLVHDETIERLAWGVFRLSARFLGIELPEPTIEEVAAVKADAFDRKAHIEIVDAIARERNLEARESETAIPIVGNSSRFNRVFYDGRPARLVKLAGHPQRKVRLDDSESGKFLLAIWSMGRKTLERMTESMPDACRERLKQMLKPFTKQAPYWMTNRIMFS